MKIKLQCEGFKMQDLYFMAHVFILSSKVDNKFCLAVLNLRANLHRRHPPFPYQQSSTIFSTPNLSTFINGGGGEGGSEKWFFPESVPHNVVRPQHFRPPLLFPLIIEPSL
jgi:hypothetical protein